MQSRNGTDGVAAWEAAPEMNQFPLIQGKSSPEDLWKACSMNSG